MFTRTETTGYFDEYRPQGLTETHLVQSLADISWRLNQVVKIEANLVHPATLATLSAHSLRLSRQFERTLCQLHQIQRQRKEGKGNSPRGFVFSDHENLHRKPS